MFYYVMDAHVRDICHETHDCRSGSLEVAQAKFGFAAPYSGVLYARTLCVVVVSRLICMVGEIIIFTLQL